MRLKCAVLAALAIATLTFAQAPAFEVASVKPNTTADPPTSFLRPNSFTTTNESLTNLITMAYRIPWYRLSGHLERLADRYDVSGKFPEGANLSQLNGMLQRLLADRFKLKAHFEDREQPVFLLVFAGADKRLGPDLRRSEVDCAPIMAARATTRTDVPGPSLNDKSSCFTWMTSGRLVVNDMPIDTLGSLLAGIVNRVVVNRTALQGRVSFTLRFAPEGTTAGDDPSIFTALQEQLGLKLEPTRDLVEMLVIDSVERPTPD